MKLILSILFLTLSFIAQADQEKLGLGVMFGNPTGLNGKYWLNDDHAVDGAFGLSIGEHTEGSLHGDYLLHKKGVLVFNEVHPLDLYYGVGGRMEFADTIQLGLRVPVGIAHMFDNQRADLFGEIAPILDFVGTNGLEISLGVGARYYFN